MEMKERDLKIVDKFLDETHYQCNEATRNFIANSYPSKLLDDIWNLIAYQGLTEKEAILRTEEVLKENKRKWEGEKPFSGFVALEIAKNWMRDADSEQWSYPAKNISEKLKFFFQYAIDISVINSATLKTLQNKYKSNQDLIIGEILSLSLHILNHHSQANSKSPKIRKFFIGIAELGQSVEKRHRYLCDLALDYYDSERNRFLSWVKRAYPTDYVNHEQKNQFSYLLVLIKNAYRNNTSYVFSKREWENASQECQKQMLADWVGKRQSALDIAKYHVIESEEDKELNRAQEIIEDAEEMFEAAQLYDEYVHAIAAGATGLSLPPIIRIKGKRYDRDVHPSVVLSEAEKWLNEAINKLEEIKSKYAE